MRSRRHHREAQPALPSWLQRRGEHLPAPRTPEGDSARIEALAEQAGAPIREVLREVADFRLALETDMIIAAAAADADELGLVSDVLDGERAGLAAFQERMLSHLSAPDLRSLSQPDEVALARAARSERRAGRARLVAAAAAFVALIGGGITVSAPSLREETPDTEAVALALADEQLSTLTGQIVRSASSADITVAATELHATLESLIADHAEGDPQVVEMIAEMIREEQRLFVVNKSSAKASVLADVARLVRKLKRVAPPKVLATLLPVAPPKSGPPSSPAPKPSPTAKASASPKPSPTPAKPSPTPSPKPSASSSSSAGGGNGGNPIPTARP
ncbi:MAG TPA: hypothetical protein VNB94_06585 [Mycobacteriales bacterium]|nr:hypothetical protein [Mycobacteriales bacterium]